MPATHRRCCWAAQRRWQLRHRAASYTLCPMPSAGKWQESVQPTPRAQRGRSFLWSPPQYSLAPQCSPGACSVCARRSRQRRMRRTHAHRCLHHSPPHPPTPRSHSREIKPVSMTQRRTMTEECPKSYSEPAAGSMHLLCHNFPQNIPEVGSQGCGHSAPWYPPRRLLFLPWGVPLTFLLQSGSHTPLFQAVG